MFSVIENSVTFDTFYLVKLIFGKYSRYFDANRVADLLQLHAIRVLVREFFMKKKKKKNHPLQYSITLSCPIKSTLYNNHKKKHFCILNFSIQIFIT